MGGMGKTTLARVVYHMISKEFEACSFIEDVRENSEKHGLVGLQQKLISNILEETDLKIRDKYDGVLKIRKRLCRKRIFLILDDVDELDQLKMLAGEHNWFGPGSRIIITTRDVHVLEMHRVDEIYEVKGLYDRDAFQLFCSKAFQKDHVPNEYLVMFEEFLKYAAGLPLALEVLGSFLFKKDTNEWKSALKRLKEYSNTEILNVLKISFDGLQELEKEIFLHIACFFNHNEKDDAVEVLDSLDLHAVIGLKELVNKSLLKINNEDGGDILWMHDLLEEMGKNIVREECPNDCGKRSRLWRNEDIGNVLRKNKENEVVQAMDILFKCDDNGDEIEEACWSLENISQMYSLKFLRIDVTFHVPKHLPNSLRVLSWEGYPSKSLPSTFQLDELVLLDLTSSKIEQLWIGIKNFDKLKIINLSCSDLSISPDFTGVPNLKKLTLAYCRNLCELHPSVGILKNLVLLDLQHCGILKTIPEFMGNMECLQIVDLDSTAIMELPSSIGGLIDLTSLTLSHCNNLLCLPSTICYLKSLECLDLSWCSSFENLPENLGNVEGLKKLYLCGTAIKELPSSIEHLTRLTLLALQSCKNLVCLPSTICNLKSLECLEISWCSSFENLPKNLGNVIGLKKLCLSETAIKELPSSIERLMHLTSLTLYNCHKLVSLPNTTCGFKFHGALDLSKCSRFKNLPENPWIIEGLEMLDLSETVIEELPSSIKHLTSLTSLTLKGCKYLVCLPSTICSLKSLKSLDLSGCSNLYNLPENLGNVKSLQKLDLSKTAIKELPSSIEHLTRLTLLALQGCKNLVCIPSTICNLKSLECLEISGCSSVENLPKNLGNVIGLKKLDLSGTAIKELPSSIEHLTSLTTLTLRYCMNLVRLPSTICGLRLLNSLDLFGCLKFDNLPENVGNIEGLEVLNLCWTAIKEVPSSIVLLKNLKQLNIHVWKLSDFYSQPASLETMTSLQTSSIFLPTSPLERIGLPLFLYSSLPTSSVLVALPSLSSLHSLMYLRITDCDLLSIPDDIGCFSFLECLNLSGNNFVSLPKSMSQLSNLRSLYLEGCKRLQSLGNVPLTINTVIANDCSSLERLPELQFYSFWPRFQCFNCFKLVDYIQNGSNMLQGLPNIVIPGGEIPKWFSHECRGDSMQLSFRGFDELIGIALCVVFVPNGSRQYHIYQNFKCNFWLNGLYIAGLAQSYYFRTKYGGVESPHIWLLYLSTHHYVSNWGKIRSCIDANGFSQLEIKIYAEVVEKIGVQLVYKQDMEDPNQTMTQCINNNSTLYEDLGVVHDIDDSSIESNRNKQSRDVDDEAGPSGEGYSNEEPQPKWIQREFFDFFAREDEMSKKLESIHGGKSDCYQDSEDPNQTITQLCINSRMLYEDIGDRHRYLYNSAAEGSSNKLSRDEEDGAGPSGEGFSNKEPELMWIHRVGEFMADYEDSSQREIIDFFAMEGGDQTSKKLGSTHGGKRDSYQDIEDPNQTITQLSINSRTLYEDLGDRHHDLYDSTLEGSRNKRSCDEDGEAGSSGEGYSGDEPPSKDLEDVWLILMNIVECFDFFA